jgi:hypothetical protein
VFSFTLLDALIPGDKAPLSIRQEGALPGSNNDLDMVAKRKIISLVQNQTSVLCPIAVTLLMRYSGYFMVIIMFCVTVIFETCCRHLELADSGAVANSFDFHVSEMPGMFNMTSELQISGSFSGNNMP